MRDRESHSDTCRSAENKITKDNAWHLNFIAHMPGRYFCPGAAGSPHLPAATSYSGLLFFPLPVTSSRSVARLPCVTCHAWTPDAFIASAACTARPPADIILSEQPGEGGFNFQRASCGLDASVRIYAKAGRAGRARHCGITLLLTRAHTSEA